MTVPATRHGAVHGFDIRAADGFAVYLPGTVLKARAASVRMFFPLTVQVRVQQEQS